MDLLEERIGMKVRFATLRKEIRVVEKERSRVNDYLQAVGLLYAAQEVCTKAAAPVFSEDSEDTEEVKEPAPPKTEIDLPPKTGLLQKIRRKFNNFINEGETEEEKNED